MVYSLIETEDSLNLQEANEEEVCVLTALKHGYTPVDAALCDEGNLDCPDCPLKSFFKEHSS